MYWSLLFGKALGKVEISVLLPVYNAVNYVCAAVESVLSQEGCSFELIILDDLSDDGTEHLLQKYKVNGVRLYRSNKRMGIAAALNFGIGVSCGQFIARMDADDISLPGRFAKQLSFLRGNSNVAICGCGYECFEGCKRVVMPNRSCDSLKVEALFYSPLAHPTVMWRRKMLEKVGLCYHESMPPVEDYDLFTRALVLGLQMSCVQEVLYRYRIHHGQQSSSGLAVRDKSAIVKTGYIREMLPLLPEWAVEKMANVSNVSLLELPFLFCLVVVGNTKSTLLDGKILRRILFRYFKSRVKVKFKLFKVCFQRRCGMRIQMN